MDDPQEIRRISASLTPYLAKDSAGSSESATRDNKNQDHVYRDDFKLTPVAEAADLAESQSSHSNFIADDLRKNCGLGAASTFQAFHSHDP